MKKPLLIFFFVSLVLFSSFGYAVGTFDELHKIRFDSQGREIASYMDTLSDGRIFEIYSDGVIEERGQGIGQLFAFTSSNLDWLQTKCKDSGGGLIYSNHPQYSTSKCLALTESDKKICQDKGYTNPIVCGTGSLGTGDSTKTTICTTPYTSQTQCEQCFNDYKCTGSNGQIRTKIRFDSSTQSCFWDNRVDECPSGTTCTLYYRNELPICAGDCIDSDGFDLTNKGKVTYFGETLIDSCSGDNVIEYTCQSKNGAITKTEASCGSGSSCKDGKCVVTSSGESGTGGGAGAGTGDTGSGGGESTNSCIKEGNLCKLKSPSGSESGVKDSEISTECETGFCFDVAGSDRDRCEEPICCSGVANIKTATIGTACTGSIVPLSECGDFSKLGITQEKINNAKNTCGGTTGFPEEGMEEDGEISTTDGEKSSLTISQLKQATKTKIKNSACGTDDECSKRTGFTTSCSGATNVIEIVEEKFDSLFNKIFGTGIEGICIAEPKDDKGDFDLSSLNPCSWGGQIAGEKNGCLVGWGIIGIVILLIIFGRRQ